MLQNINQNIKQDISEVPQDPQGKSIYSCECGKKYLSFPALYLHAKTKHRVKFTSKPNSQVCSIKESDNVKEITYFILPELKDGKKQPSSPGDRELRLLTTNERSRTQRTTNLVKSLGVFRGVFKHFYSEFPEKSSNKILETFEEYLEREFKEQRHLMNKTFAISNIPNKLNSFVLETLQGYEGVLIGSEEWKQACKELLLLSEWLKKENYTELLVQCDVV